MNAGSAHLDGRAPRGRSLTSTGLLTLVVVALAFAAFDDITTDNATRFPLEYAMLLGAAAWCVAVAAWLFRTGYHILAILSLLAVTGAVWGGRAVGARTPGLELEHMTMWAALVWFFALSILLLAWGVRNRSRRPSTA